MRELAEAARALRRFKGEKRGRPPTSRAEKAITRFENALILLEEGKQLIDETNATPEEREHLARLLDRAHDLVRSATRSTLFAKKPGELQGSPLSTVRPIDLKAG